MNCPVCTSENLLMSERSGIEIDYCPKCRGVWLDRGELDKMIERASQEVASESMRPPAPGFARHEDGYRNGYDDERAYRDHDYRSDDDDDRYRRHGRKKRRGFMDDLFDFGD